ncbi:MAG: type VI secretion system tip protein VgrG [Polyangiaceae bacterium]|nr:type VI secretion system tip protein VgrG [Polyangiaceae bacterium]
MKNLEISFASADDSAFDIRSFVVHEGLSSLFSVSLTVVSPHDAIDLGEMLGQRAEFRIHGGARFGVPERAGRRGGDDDGDHERGRAFTGIIKRFEQIHAEPTGLSTYELEIVPELWLLTQRTGYRVFQGLSAVDLAKALLAKWKIKPVLKISEEHPKLEYRVQYGESDFDFFSRTLEEAGITYRFTYDLEDGETKLELSDAPERAEPRPAVRFDDSPNYDARAEFVTDVRIGQRIRPGAVVVRDHDFRRRSEVDLSGRSEAKGLAIEQDLEVYKYKPGAFLVAKDGDGGRHEPKLAARVAEKRLRAARRGSVTISFDTNAFDLAPGTVTSISRHPHPDLKGRVLITSLTLSGSPDDEWSASAEAVPAKEPYHPPRATKQPKVTGVQSGIVVGPPGQDIHCDEYGRVKVRFPWDRDGKGDDTASCWVRVSQGWAGAGFGMMNIPRVGQEVLVAFLDGNPDLPVVVGRAFNATARMPYSLPAEKTVSYWRTSSTPGGDGYSELVFEDKKGAEYVRLRAERDLHKLVRNDEVESTGASRTTSVGRNRTVTVGGADSTIVGKRQDIVINDPDGIKPPTTISMEEGKITYSTGKASLTLEGDNISLDAEGSISIRSKTGDVIIQGGPKVKINCE